MDTLLGQLDFATAVPHPKRPPPASPGGAAFRLRKEETSVAYEVI